MEENTRKMQEMQMLEQNLQNLVMQKQAFQLESNETEAALEELKKADDDVFKVIGQLMIKSDKTKIEEELVNKKKMIDLRIETFDKQEKTLSEKFSKIRDEFMAKSEEK